METIRKAKFSDHFSVANAEALIGFEATGNRNKSNRAVEIITKALKGLLNALRAEGALSEISGSKGHGLDFAESWNRIVAGEPTAGDFEALGDEIALMIAFQGTMPADKSTPEPRAAHQAICAYADAGRFNVRAGDSGVTGETVYVNFDGWAPTAKAYADGKGRPLADAATIGPQVGEITFPTGVLLINDWFRCEGFQEALEEDEPRTTLNSEAGRVASTLHKLSKGIVSFHLGNTSPDIFLRDGALIIGEDRAFAEYDWDSDGDGIDKRDIEGRVGDVCTDYWAATIVDQKTLMDLLEAQLGSAEAAFDAYAEYRRTTFDRITEVRVEPGTYEVHFGPDHEAFAKAFRHGSVPALAEVAAYGALIPKRH